MSGSENTPAKHGSKGAGHGGPASGYSWPQFKPGHTLSTKHGAYASPARLGAETAELAAELVPLVPAYLESDSIMVELLALTLRRIARAEPVVAAAEDAGDLEKSQRLRADQRSWVNASTRLLELLGMSPTSRARLGLDLTRARHDYEYRRHVAETHDAVVQRGDVDASRPAESLEGADNGA